MGVNSATKNPTPLPNHDNFPELNGVTTTDNNVSETRHETDSGGVNGIMNPPPQSTSEQYEPDTLPDLVLNVNNSVNEANATEDEDEAAEALLQLSKSDTLPEDNTELPLGVLPIDTAPVPITLGNQDVLNTIENFKQSNDETGTVSNINTNDNQNNQDDTKRNNDEKENKSTQKKYNTEAQSAHESSPPTSPAKGSLVIVKHGIKRKKSTGHTYKCVRCDKRKNSTH